MLMAADASLADLDILPPLRAETGAKSIDAMGCGGGYVLNSVHNLQADVPAAKSLPCSTRREPATARTDRRGRRRARWAGVERNGPASSQMGWRRARWIDRRG